MTRPAAAPIADVVHERLLELAGDAEGATVEQTALAMIEGAARCLFEISPAPAGEIRARILNALNQGRAIDVAHH